MVVVFRFNFVWFDLMFALLFTVRDFVDRLFGVMLFGFQVRV